MKGIFSEVSRILESGQRLVIARIIRQKGSTPRSTGTRCLILEDGSILGTIGGGRMEHLVMERAREVMRNQRSVIMKLALYGKDSAGDGNALRGCGGYLPGACFRREYQNAGNLFRAWPDGNGGTAWCDHYTTR